MRKLGLGRLLRLVVVLPLLALAGFGSVLILQTLGGYREIERAAALEQLVSAASRVTIKALNEESNATNAFELSASEDDRTDMIAARKRSDEAMGSFKAAAASVDLSDANALQLVSGIEQGLDGLQAYRTKADARTLLRRESGVLLQPITARLADLVHRIAGLIDEVRISRLLLALYSVMQMNDGASIEAGRTDVLLRDGPLDSQSYQLLLLGLAKQSIFAMQFDDLGPAEVRDRLRAFKDGPQAREIDMLRPAVLAVNGGGQMSEPDARRWREATEARRVAWSQTVQSTVAELTATTDALRANATWYLVVYVAMTCLIVFVAMAVGRLTLLTVRRRLGELTQVMKELADGRLSAVVPGRDRFDEIGVMAETVEVFKRNAITMRRLEQERSEQKEQAAIDKLAAVNDLADSFEAEVLGVVRTVAAAASQLQQNANLMNAAATETDRQSRVVAAAAEQAIGNVRTVANAAEELSSSIDEIGQQASAATKITASAVSQAGATSQMVQSLVTAVERIRQGHRADQRHRVADQPAGAQRDDRGTPCGRAGQGICRGRGRGEEPGLADREGDRGHHLPDQRGSRRHQQGRRRHPDDQRHDPRDQCDFRHHCGGGGGAEFHHRRNRA